MQWDDDPEKYATLRHKLDIFPSEVFDENLYWEEQDKQRHAKARAKDTITLGKNTQTHQLITVNQEQLESGGYLLGVQGVGKSSLLLSLILQQLQQKESVIVLDPHGSLIYETIARMPQERIQDTYLLSLSEPEKHYFGMNIFACKDPNSRKEKAAVRNLVMHAFGRLWPETKNGLYFGNVLRPIVATLIEKSDLTLAHVPRLFYDDNFRRHYTKGLENFEAVGFWSEYEAWSRSKRERYVDPLLDRVKKLLSDDIVRYILCQKKSKLDLGQLIRQRKNILLHLPLRDPVYEFTAPIIGTFFTTLLQGAIFGMPPDQRAGCTLVIDEFQNFVTEDNERFFSEGRKYKVKQILAHQYTAQLDKDNLTSMKAAATSAYTIVCFRTNTDDAPRMADLFSGLSRKPTDIYIDVLDRLEKHPNATVKEFYWQMVKPLQEGAKKAKTSGAIYSYNFGLGNTNFNISTLEAALTTLNNLFYFSQKNEVVHQGYLQSFWKAFIEINKSVACGEPLPAPEHNKYRQLQQKVVYLKNELKKNEIPDAEEEKKIGNIKYQLWQIGIRQMIIHGEAIATYKRILKDVYPEINPDKPPVWLLGITMSRGIWEGAPGLPDEVWFLQKIELQKLHFLKSLEYDQLKKTKDELTSKKSLIEGTVEKRKRKSQEELRQTEKDIDRLLATTEKATVAKTKEQLVQATEALIHEPLTADKSKISEQEIEQTLQQLENRRAYVKIASQVYAMETLDVNSSYPSASDTIRRRNTIIAQTKDKYCRGLREIEAEINAVYAVEQPTPTVDKQESHLRQGDAIVDEKQKSGYLPPPKENKSPVVRPQQQSDTLPQQPVKDRQASYEDIE